MSKFKEMRTKKGFTQRDIASRLGVAINTVVNWDIGSGYSDENAQKLCELFDCELTDLKG